MNSDEIKNHWESWADEYQINLRATTKTSTIKKLEINAIYRAMQNTPFCGERGIEVIEVGCGNGFNCFALAEFFAGFNFTGVDYVDKMIESANVIKRDQHPKYMQVNFQVGNLLSLDLHPNLLESYHFVFTDRCIINLHTIDLQLSAIDQLINKVKLGGYLIILENMVHTFQKQNQLRESVGLPGRSPAEFNLFIDEEKLLDHVRKNMDLIQIDDFGSLHDIVLYVLVPMINSGEVDYAHPLVEAATHLSISASASCNNSFGSFGQNRLYLFKKVKES